MTRRPSHRLDERGTREQQRAFHRARLLGAIHAAVELLDAMRSLAPGVYEVAPEIVLRARDRVGLAEPYLRDEREATV